MRSIGAVFLVGAVLGACGGTDSDVTSRMEAARKACADHGGFHTLYLEQRRVVCHDGTRIALSG